MKPSWYVERPLQNKYADIVRSALTNRKHLIIEGPPGIGKSLGYLVPVLEFINAQSPTSVNRVVISTHSKALQDQLANKDLFAAQQITGVVADVVVLKGKQNYLCKRRLDAYVFSLFGNQEAAEKLVDWAATTETGLVDEAPTQVDVQQWNVDETCSEDCAYASVCPYIALRENMSYADIVVVNHALYLSEIKLKPDDGWAILPDHNITIFDEAHHLERVATDALSISLSTDELTYMANRAARLFKRDKQASDAAITARSYIATIEDAMARVNKQNFFLSEMSDDDLKAVGVAIGALMEILALISSRAAIRVGVIKDKQAAAAYTNMKMMCKEYSDRLSELFSDIPGRIRHGAVTNSSKILTSTPVDVASALSKRLWSSVGTMVLTSGTITTGGVTSFDYVINQLGLPKDITRASIESPFDYKKQAVLYVPRIAQPGAQVTDSHIRTLADEVRSLTNITQGRAFVLCTSRYVQDALYNALNGTVPFTCMKQGDGPPRDLLRRFIQSGNGILFATSTFWEGVDVQGDALSLVIIDRIPFEMPKHPVYVARQKLAQKGGKDWFGTYALPNATLKLKQGLGRAIRGPEDTAVLAILDPRLLEKPYGGRIIAALPQTTIFRDISSVVKRWEEINAV